MKVVSVLLVLPLAIASGAIDFTPVPGVRVLDGIKFKQLTFNENGHQITYEQPAGWTYHAEPARIVFAPADVTQAEAVIEQSRLEVPLGFDEAAVKGMQEQVLRSVPS